MAKEFTGGFYLSKAWRTTRNAYVKSVGGLCEECLSKGLYVPGEIVHHKIELTPDNINNPDVTLNFNNLKLVCRECHSAEHHSHAKRRFTILPDGSVISKSDS